MINPLKKNRIQEICIDGEHNNICPCNIHHINSIHDESDGVCLIAYGDYTKNKKRYIDPYNEFIAKNSASYLNTRINGGDKAASLIIISFTQLFDCVDYNELYYFLNNPENTEQNIIRYERMISRVIFNIIKVFYDQCDIYNIYEFTHRFFERVNQMPEYKQLSIYFKTGWDLFGTTEKDIEENIKTVIINDIQYKFSFKYKRNNEYYLNTGMLSQIVEIFKLNDVEIDGNRGIILQFLIPVGTWNSRIYGNKIQYTRYSDISIGISARGNLSSADENLYETVAREAQEEISLIIKDWENIEFIDNWGDLSIFSYNIGDKYFTRGGFLI